jgi:hypothetical protein
MNTLKRQLEIISNVKRTCLTDINILTSKIEDLKMKIAIAEAEEKDIKEKKRKVEEMEKLKKEEEEDKEEKEDRKAAKRKHRFKELICSELEKYNWFSFEGDELCTTECQGWDGLNRKCDCQNQRVNWEWDDEDDSDCDSIHPEVF